MTTLKIPYGLDSEGLIVHVDDVPRGKACGARCASCDSELVAKKGEVRTHYFAHYSGNRHGCEGWLHKTAKRILYERITRSINQRSPIPIKWSCPDEEPQLVHEVDLLGKGILNNARLEQYLPTWNIKPDITLMAEDTPKGLIEVVDTHRPEPPVLASGLPVCEVHVSEGADLEVLAKDIIPVAVMHNYPCPDPVCPICYRRRSKGCNYYKKRHMPTTHDYCDTCKTWGDRKHFHHNCSKCGVVVRMGGNAVYRAKWRDNAWHDESWVLSPLPLLNFFLCDWCI